LLLITHTLQSDECSTLCSRNMKCLYEALEKVCKFASVCNIVECEFVSALLRSLGDDGHAISMILSH